MRVITVTGVVLLAFCDAMALVVAFTRGATIGEALKLLVITVLYVAVAIEVIGEPVRTKRAKEATKEEKSNGR